MDTKLNKRKINLVGLNKTEKILLLAILVSFLIIATTFIYEWFLSPITTIYWWEKGWNENASESEYKTISALLFATFIALMVIIFGTRRLYKDEKFLANFENSKEFASEVTIHLNSWTVIYSILFAAVFLFALSFSNTMQEHLFDGKYSIQLMKQALHFKGEYATHISAAIEESKREAQEEFKNGAMFVFMSLIFFREVALLVTWLKFREARQEIG